MTRTVLLLIMILVSGCSFIMNEDDNMKTIGIKKEDAAKLTQDIEKQRPDNPTEARIMQKVEGPEPAPLRIK